MKAPGFLAAALCASAAFAGSVAAQVPPPPVRQPGRPMMGGRMQDPARAERMRAMIEERWGRAVQTQLALSDQQMERLRGVQRATAERRLGHERREMELARAIGEQLRPGVSADQDSLALLLDGLAALRVERAQAEQQELRELAQFLTPVQRARLLVMRRQFEARIDAIRGGRPGMGGPMRPGAPPGAVPGGPPGEEPPGS